MIRIRYTPAARSELVRILDHIRLVSPSGSRNVSRRIRQIIELLKTYPDAGRLTENATVRRIVATPYPYLIFYERRGDTVVIHAVRHGARNPEEMLGSSPES